MSIKQSRISEKTRDHILGMIVGQALGDAYGLSVEFKDKKWIEENYKNTEIPFFDYIETSHNKRWKRGDWTDDTDQMIQIMEVLTTHRRLSQSKLAERLYWWMRTGIPECGDTSGMGIGETTYSVLSHPEYHKNPTGVAYEVYNKIHTHSNGALMRSSIISAFHFSSNLNVYTNTHKAANVTHASPKCEASCVYMTQILRSIFDCIEHSRPFDFDQIKREAYHWGSLAFTQHKELEPEFKNATNYNHPSTIPYDDNNWIGHTYICLQAFIYGMHENIDEDNKSQSFKDILHVLNRQGGDSDTNLAVCGAILGARIGYSNLPQDWIQKMPYIDFLLKKANNFLDITTAFPKDHNLYHETFHFV